MVTVCYHGYSLSSCFPLGCHGYTPSSRLPLCYISSTLWMGVILTVWCLLVGRSAQLVRVSLVVYFQCMLNQDCRQVLMSCGLTSPELLSFSISCNCGFFQTITFIFIEIVEADTHFLKADRVLMTPALDLWSVFSNLCFHPHTGPPAALIFTAPPASLTCWSTDCFTSTSFFISTHFYVFSSVLWPPTLPRAV